MFEYCCEYDYKNECLFIYSLLLRLSFSNGDSDDVHGSACIDVVRGGRGEVVRGGRKVKAIVLDSKGIKKFVKAGNDFDV